METTLVSFAAPAALAAASGLFVLALVVALLRRPAIPPSAALIAGVGTSLLALSAGQPAWRRPSAGDVVVMVDVSPSTRTARYRETTALNDRVRQLLPGRRYHILYFAEGSPDATGGAVDGALRDRTVDRTVFHPPPAASVLLFSDAQFDPPPVAPPTFVVVDPLLESPADAAVERLGVRENRLLVTTVNAGGQRTGAVSGGAIETLSFTAAPGYVVHDFPLPNENPATVTARLGGGVDAWPENDALSIVTFPPPQADRWWVGQRSPAAGWKRLAAADLPSDPASYLAPAVVVIDNVPAADFSDVQLQRLRQYVRDLGGALVLLGGDRAYAAGEYQGSVLESLSPLASTPPEPSRHWVFLIDSSGSMSAAVGGTTRWQVAVDAVTRALLSLPPADAFSVGGFAGDVRWWVSSAPLVEAASRSFPPPGARPSGPTELGRALETAAATDAGGLAREVVLLTDGNAPLPNAEALGRAVRDRNTRVHLLAIGDGGIGLEALRRLVEQTGGTFLHEADPSRWASSVAELTRAATPDLLVSSPTTVRFLNELAKLPGREIRSWNRTWLKSDATRMAEAGGSGADQQGKPSPIVAQWQVGEGRVLAAAFPATEDEVEAFAALVARPPRDPRLRVNWVTGRRVRVTVDAAEGDECLNGLQMAVELFDANSSGLAGPVQTVGVQQAAPGRYSASFDAPSAPAVATLRVGGRAVERIALAGRYPPEFDRIGNDRATMRELAGRTGGRVIEPGDNTPLSLPSPRREVPLTSPAAAIGAVLVAIGLVRWRVGT